MNKYDKHRQTATLPALKATNGWYRHACFVINVWNIICK